MKAPKNLIIFGAGASFGSGDVEPYPPPMGNKLFEKLAEIFPLTWGRITGDLRDAFEADFETGMVALGKSSPQDMDPLQRSMAKIETGMVIDKSSPQDMAPLQRSMAAFFFKFSLGAHNLYSELADQIKAKKWNGALVTRNYEMLLNMAISTAGMSTYLAGPDAPAHPIEDSVELCMPHGCCNIFCEGTQANPQSVVFIDSHAVGNPVFVNDPEEFGQRINGNAVPPVMSYFNPDKSTMACADLIERQRSRYSELVENAENISIVGVLPRIHDSHIWKPLADSNANITFCAGSRAAPKFDSWATGHKSNGNSVSLAGYFEAEYESLMSAVDLE